MVWPVKSVIAVATLGMAFLTAFALPVDARGIHGFGRGMASHGSQFAGGRRHGNDSYIKAASDDRDKSLNTKRKSICRGCGKIIENLPVHLLAAAFTDHSTAAH
jgi:hypothetical protein